MVRGCSRVRGCNTAALSPPRSSSSHSSLGAAPPSVAPPETRMLHALMLPVLWLARSRKGMSARLSAKGSARESTMAVAHASPSKR